MVVQHNLSAMNTNRQMGTVTSALSKSTEKLSSGYKIKEVKRMLEERLIKRDKECINELITNHQKYVKERRNTKQDK